MQLFNPERLPGIKDVPGLAEYGQGLVKAYAQYVLPSFESSEDLQPGDGAVVQKVGGTWDFRVFAGLGLDLLVSSAQDGSMRLAHGWRSLVAHPEQQEQLLKASTDLLDTLAPLSECGLV